MKSLILVAFTLLLAGCIVERCEWNGADVSGDLDAGELAE